MRFPADGNAIKNYDDNASAFLFGINYLSAWVFRRAAFVSQSTATGVPIDMVNTYIPIWVPQDGCEIKAEVLANPEGGANVFYTNLDGVDPLVGASQDFYGNTSSVIVASARRFSQSRVLQRVATAGAHQVRGRVYTDTNLTDWNEEYTSVEVRKW